MAYWQDTPGHAWLYLSSDELARMPEIARRPGYEEDVEWTIAVLALPELAENKKLFGAGKEATLQMARELCRDYYPDIFQQLTGEKATPENSRARAEAKFNQDHANDWVVIVAYGDWKEGVPKGFVLGEATLGGKRKNIPLRSFLIPQERYTERGPFGYVVQSDDKEVNQVNTR